MSDDLNEFGGYETDEQPKKSEGGTLRAKLEEALKRASDAEAKLAEATKQLSQRTAQDVFSKLGVPDKVRKLYTGDVSEEAITTWVQEYADVFGITPEGGDEKAVEETPEDTARNDQIRSVQNASKLGFDGGSTGAALLAEAEAKLKGGASEADIDAIIQKAFAR